MRMSKLFAAALALAPAPSLAATMPTDLFFSEYVEGSSFNKYLEIFNGTDAVVDLSLYSVALYYNGAATAGRTIALSGQLASGDVFVMGHVSATLPVAVDLASGNVNFNGDDTVALLNGGVLVDVIGQIGTDPGAFWGIGDATTQNDTLRRMASVAVGDADGSDTFTPSLEWVGLAQDVVDGLGAHELDVQAPADVPAPAAGALMLGALGLLGLRRRRA